MKDPVPDLGPHKERAGARDASQPCGGDLGSLAGGPSGVVLAIGLLIFAGIWLFVLASVSLSPPVDNIEQLTWARSLEWGYYKHPPLPTWLMALAVGAFGRSDLTSYVLGAAVTLGAVAIFWHLLADLRGASYASVALLAGLCITYYNDRLFYFNHNTVLLLFSAASGWLAWRALATKQLWWWPCLGVAMGLAALSKYQAAIPIASLAIIMIHARVWRDPRQLRGLLVAALTALAVFVPHFNWLRANDFAPMDYAVGSSLGKHAGLLSRTTGTLHWLVDQIFNRLLPALLLLGAVWTGAAVRHRTRNAAAIAPRASDRPSRTFIVVWGAAPLLLIAILGFTTGAELQLQWGTPHLLFAVPVAMEFMPLRIWSQVRLLRALGVFLAIQTLLLGVNIATSPRGAAALRDRHWTTFDSAALARLVAAPARRALGGPIAIVSGSTSVSGVLALRLPERPLVLIDGRNDRSPWVSVEAVRQCGMLEIGSLQELPGGTPVGAAFPNLAWRVLRRNADAAPCGTHD